MIANNGGSRPPGSWTRFSMGTSPKSRMQKPPSFRQSPAPRSDPSHRNDQPAMNHRNAQGPSVFSAHAESVVWDRRRSDRHPPTEDGLWLGWRKDGDFF